MINKKHNKILSNIKHDIKSIQFKLNHKSLENIKKEITRRGKITFCKGRLLAPYLIALGISFGSFSIFGATPFILDKKKNYEKTMKEIDASDHIRVITQYDDFETNENVITLYQKWYKNANNTYSRDIKIYRLNDMSESKIIELLNGNINNIEELLGSPISTKVENFNNLEPKEIDRESYLQARIYSEDENNYIYVNQPVSKNVGETFGWLFTLIVLESIALCYRGLSSFDYKKQIRRINSIYSQDSIDLLEKRLKIKEKVYQVLKIVNKTDNNNLSLYLDKNNNIQISNLNPEKLKDLLLFATNIELSLKDKLTFNEQYTYGTEIELENVKKKLVKETLLKYESNGWKLKIDYSLHKGIEIVSPVLYDNEECWKELNNVCENSKKIANVDKNSSLHVHVGAHILGSDKKAWLNFIKLWAVYENIIFRFAYGEFYNYRDSLIEYAPPVSQSMWQDYIYLKNINADLKEIIETINHGKYNSINFHHVKYDTIDKIIEGNTIEIRCGNSTRNTIIIQNYIYFLLSLFRYAKSDKFNDEILDERHEECKDIYDNIDMYNEIYLEQALELCDLIFDNNLDKMYFLHQYLKDFKVDEKKFDKNKTFTKK